MECEKTNLLVVSGFGHKDGIKELYSALSATDRFRRTKMMLGCPVEDAATSPYILADKIADELCDPTTLVGYSHGSFLSLRAACKKRFIGIRCGVFANGPLNPEVPVEPPKGVDDSFFNKFELQYRMRVDVARQCMEVLREIKQRDSELLANCVTVVSQKDIIIPPKAQALPGLLPSITLPHEIRGHGMGRAKIAALLNIVAGILDKTQTLQCHL